MIFARGSSITKPRALDKRSHLSVLCLRAPMKKEKPGLKFSEADVLQLHIAHLILSRTEIEKKANACFLQMLLCFLLHLWLWTTLLVSQGSSPVMDGCIFLFSRVNLRDWDWLKQTPNTAKLTSCQSRFFMTVWIIIRFPYLFWEPVSAETLPHIYCGF